MKNKFSILLFFIPLIICGQKSLKDNNFNGTLIFKEISYFDRLTRELTDTTITFYSFDLNTKDINSEIEISQFYSAKNDIHEFKFTKFKLIKRDDSLFIKYFDTIDRNWRLDYIFPLNKRDTVTECKGYKISIDSVFTYKKSINFSNNEPCYDNTFLKDTLIKFKDYSFDCYLIEQNHNYLRNQMRVRKKLLIDKLTLVPVYEIEYTFAQRKGRLIPTNKWVVTKQMKLIAVD